MLADMTKPCPGLKSSNRLNEFSVLLAAAGRAIGTISKEHKKTWQIRARDLEPGWVWSQAGQIKLRLFWTLLDSAWKDSGSLSL